MSQPKEEVLPGESQPELLSWMAMCSDELEDRTSTSGKLQNDTFEGGKNEDSPYNEIMTILRVLEEKEDESSCKLDFFLMRVFKIFFWTLIAVYCFLFSTVMKILNKRSELRTPSETPSLVGNLISTADSDIVSCVSAANQNEIEYSRPSPSVDSELKLAAKLDSSSKTYNSAACIGEDTKKQLPSVQGELRFVVLQGLNVYN